MDHIRTAIDAATNGDANAFRDGIHQALAAKMHDAIELKKLKLLHHSLRNQKLLPLKQKYQLRRYLTNENL